MLYMKCVRVPDSQDEFEHMLNASGWCTLGVRKRGTLLRKTEQTEFLRLYRDILYERVAFLRELIADLLGRERKGDGFLRLQKGVLEKELEKRLLQLEDHPGA